MASPVSISNAALAEIGADSIAAMDEGSTSSIECNRSLGNVIEELLAHNEDGYGFAIRRVTGACIASDRPADWAYAYAKPSDAMKLLRVLLPDEETYPEWDVYSTPIWDAFGPVPFVEIDGTIYTNVAGAVLEYTSSAVPYSAFTPLFRRAVELGLAARIAYSVKKDRALKGDLIQQAEVAEQRAVAADRNRHPQRQQEYVGEVALARSGIDACPPL